MVFSVPGSAPHGEGHDEVGRGLYPRGCGQAGRFRPVQGVERARTAVDQVLKAEDAVMLEHVEVGERLVGERPANRREVPVHGGDDEVAAPFVVLNVGAKVSARRSEGSEAACSFCRLANLDPLLYRNPDLRR